MLVFAGCEDQRCLLYQDLPRWGRSWRGAQCLQLASRLYLLLSGEAVQMQLHTFSALWWNFFLC